VPDPQCLDSEPRDEQPRKKYEGQYSRNPAEPDRVLEKPPVAGPQKPDQEPSQTQTGEHKKSAEEQHVACQYRTALGRSA